MNELFKVDKLSKITRKHFRMACFAAMNGCAELKGLLGVPCGDDYILYSGEGKATVQVRNYSGMLALHIVSKNGTWLISGYIDGMDAKNVIREAYRQFRRARPYIDKELWRAFDLKIADGASARWMNRVAEIEKKTAKYVKRKKKEVKG